MFLLLYLYLGAMAAGAECGWQLLSWGARRRSDDGCFSFRLPFFRGGGILIPCRIKRTDVGKLINKSSGDVEVRCRIIRRQRCNTKAPPPLNPSLLEGDMIPRVSKNRGEGGHGVEGGLVSCWHPVISSFDSSDKVTADYFHTLNQMQAPACQQRHRFGFFTTPLFIIYLLICWKKSHCERSEALASVSSTRDPCYCQ